MRQGRPTSVTFQCHRREDSRKLAKHGRAGKWDLEGRDEYSAFSQRSGLHGAPVRPTVEWRTRPSDLVTVSGASLGVEPGSQRLSSSKGQTRREAGAQSDGPPVFKPTRDVEVPEVAKLPKGWAGEEPVRPRA